MCSLKSIKHRFWSFIYTLKSQERKLFVRLKVKKSCALLLVSFQDRIWYTAAIFSTLILVHLKEIGLCCNKFLGSWGMRFIRNNRRYKFDERNKTMEYFRIVLLRQTWWGAFIFLFCFSKSGSHWKKFGLIFSFWSLVFILKSYQEKLKGFRWQKWWFSLVLFKSKHGGVPLASKTLI